MWFLSRQDNSSSNHNESSHYVYLCVFSWGLTRILHVISHPQYIAFMGYLTRNYKTKWLVRWNIYRVQESNSASTADILRTSNRMTMKFGGVLRKVDFLGWGWNSAYPPIFESCDSNGAIKFLPSITVCEIWNVWLLGLMVLTLDVSKYFEILI